MLLLRIEAPGRFTQFGSLSVSFSLCTALPSPFDSIPNKARSPHSQDYYRQQYSILTSLSVKAILDVAYCTNLVPLPQSPHTKSRPLSHVEDDHNNPNDCRYQSLCKLLLQPGYTHFEVIPNWHIVPDAYTTTFSYHTLNFSYTTISSEDSLFALAYLQNPETLPKLSVS